MSLEEQARAANAEFWEVPSRQEEVEVEAEEVGADRRMSEAGEEDEPTTTDGGDHTAGDSTDFGDRTEDDGSGNPASKNKKKERKDRKPTVLANTNTKITKVSSSNQKTTTCTIVAAAMSQKNLTVTTAATKPSKEKPGGGGKKQSSHGSAGAEPMESPSYRLVLRSLFSSRKNHHAAHHPSAARAGPPDRSRTFELWVHPPRYGTRPAAPDCRAAATSASSCASSANSVPKVGSTEYITATSSLRSRESHSRSSSTRRAISLTSGVGEEVTATAGNHSMAWSATSADRIREAERGNLILIPDAIESNSLLAPQISTACPKKTASDAPHELARFDKPQGAR
ncbi:hypothetical protein ACQ4PT_061847 [Festuca glaucescens]